MTILKPMLASEVHLDKLKYPIQVSPKLDGIRSLVINQKQLSRSFKSIPNKYVKKTLEGLLPDGIDGELVVGSVTDPLCFTNSSSGIMSQDGEPDFTYYVFDYVFSDLGVGFKNRFAALTDLVDRLKNPKVQLVPHKLVNNQEELLKAEEEFLAQGFEGLMIRDPNGPYKCGRSSTREGYLLKLKRFQDAEAVIVSCEELMHNDNIAEKDNFGRTKRSTKKEGMVPAGILGKFVAKDVVSGLEFGCGGGFTLKQRKDLWDIRDSLPGKIMTYKAQNAGTKDLPRFPVFKGLRDPDDL